MWHVPAGPVVPTPLCNIVSLRGVWTRARAKAIWLVSMPTTAVLFQIHYFDRWAERAFRALRAEHFVMNAFTSSCFSVKPGTCELCESGSSIRTCNVLDSEMASMNDSYFADG